MADKDTYQRNNKNTIAKRVSTDLNTGSNTISTKRHFRVNKRSNDKSAPLQSNPVDCNPSESVTNDLTRKLSEIDLTRSKSKNYSSRNMLRNSRPANSTKVSGQSGPSASHYGAKERLAWHEFDDLSCYTRLTGDCFTYETQNNIICLLCGKKVIGKSAHSISQHTRNDYHHTQFKKLDLRLLYEDLDKSSLQMSSIEALCDNWLSTYSLTDSSIKARNYAISVLEGIMGSINPECQFRIHGSSYYGASTRNSDINLELVHPNSKLFQSDPRSRKSIHHRLIDQDAEYGNQFNEHTMHYDLASNPVDTLYHMYRVMSEASRSLPSYPFAVKPGLSQLNRAIPSVTLNHLETGTTLNVNCYSERRFNLAQLLRTYMRLDDRLEKLSTLVKVWAKLCSIDNPDVGSYPPHAYVIMMIYYLQRTEPPVLPCLHEIAAQNVKLSNQQGMSQVDDVEEAEIARAKEARDDELEDEDEETLGIIIDENITKDLNWTSENKSPVHELFIQFFKSMIDEFSMLSNVITIRTLKPVLSRFSSQSKAIEHPTNRMISISRCIASMKTFDFIKDCFFHTYFYLTSIPIEKNLAAQKIIRKDPRDYIDLYVNMFRLNSYRAMKETSIGQVDYDPINQMMQQKLFARDVETLHALSVSKQQASLPQILAKLYDPNFFRPQNTTYSRSCHLCHSVGHSREDCPKGLIENLRDEFETYDFNLDDRANLDSSLMKLYQKEKISSQLSLEHNKILGTLKRIINQALDLNLSFVLYGSTVNNLGNCDSDLDICVTVRDNPTGKDVDCVKILQSILKVLETIVEVHQIQPVFSAKVPIIRFKFNHFDIDMSMYNQCAIYNSKLLKAYSLINPKVAPLCFCVKKFAKACGIADASRGSLSSYAWCLLVIYYLQRLDPPVLPVLQEPPDSSVRGCFGVNGWNVWFNDKPVELSEYPYSLTQLLKGFFLFYGVFDFENSVVTIRKSASISKFLKSWNGCMIAIEDPFELTYNLANRLSDPMATFILNSFAQTYRHIVKIQKIIDSNNQPNFKLDMRLFDGMEITKVGPPLRGCLHCHKIGHKLKECPEKNRNSVRSPRKSPDKAFAVGKWVK